jgi:hypothetical protein
LLRIGLEEHDPNNNGDVYDAEGKIIEKAGLLFILA